ncbi:MAG: hypothetical protein QNJ41_23725 [Xenococcaceae cyanobacterium MO_188.B32]|nr:hypothetical protein [Xenococcaceae cyanobacterium MO_188.B32]
MEKINEGLEMKKTAIGKKILEQFLSGYSVEEIAEEYSVNCLMIEHVLRCEITLERAQFRTATEESIAV